jgi:hypothetical protein
MRLTDKDLSVGVPLEWPIYDSSRRLLLSKGQALESDSEIDRIVSGGGYRMIPTELKAQLENGQHAPTQKGGTNEGTSLDKMRLMPGDRMQLQGGWNNERHYVRLIGLLPNASIIVTAIQRDKQVLLVREGQAYTVRAFSGKQAFGFNTCIKKVCNVPYPYLHLDYPRDVQGVTIRAAPRIETKIICTVVRQGENDKAVAAVISDLSPSGARVDAPGKLAEKDQLLHLTFRFHRNDDAAYFAMDAIVRSVRDEPSSEESRLRYQHGVEFVDMPRNERLLLKTLIYELMNEGGEA